MDLSKCFILLNDEPKTLQIDIIQRNDINGYSVRFKNNKRTYNYGRDKVVWLNIISVRTDIPVGKLTSLLLGMEMKGIVKPYAGGTYHLLEW